MTTRTPEEVAGEIVGDFVRPSHAVIVPEEMRAAIASAIRSAIAAETERCAGIADSFTCGICGMDGKAAAAIRARKDHSYVEPSDGE